MTEAPNSQANLAAVAQIAVIPSILDVVCRLTGMGFAAVAHVTETQWLACSVLDHINFGLKPGGELDLKSTICNEIRQHRQAVIIDNVAEDPAYCGHHTPATYGLKSYISMPILMPDGSFFGTLCAIDPHPHRVNTPEIVQTFKLFAELIAFHLDAIRRLADAKAAADEQQGISELREQFIAVLGHDLRNPVASIDAGATLILKRPHMAVEIAGQIKQSAGRISNLIESVLDFARGRLGGEFPVDKAQVVLGPVLTQVASELQRTHLDRQIEVSLDLAQPILCDSVRLSQLLSNLLANALTHGAPDRPIIVLGGVRQGVFELSVSNGGAPIQDHALSRLFQPFFRAKVRSSQEGLGLGLFICSEIAKAHAGTLEVSSTEADTRFTFRMPVSV
ncbi:GAF domain-containing sensor histidine kinase [Acidisoma cellulosilytica]|uniref:histidine kinase n=1 Tax=Acidisoma cellulosilyticum TaxID=2802395 RepID=A0A964E2T0_9PROT|nr:GAF domain-containing sensor histidine kinase [Acidisoma cellulosilyticum]MCB8879736.1 GAF domain-containing sensor histidine kinase [Acidisoma cellulosilyticum]